MEEMKKIYSEIPDFRPSWDEETQNLAKKWECTVFSSANIHDDKKIKNIALLLENQRLMNEAMCEKTQCKQHLLLITKEVFSNIIANDIAHVRAMRGPTDLIENIALAAKTRKIKVEFPLKIKENLSKTIKEIIENIDSEVIEDISNNSGTVMGCNSDIDEKIEEMANVILEKCKERPKFILCSEQTKSLIKEDHLMQIYTSNLVEDNKIIISSQENYIYAPYVPFALTPCTLDENTFHPKKYFLTRYDKRLKKSKGIGKIIIK